MPESVYQPSPPSFAPRLPKPDNPAEAAVRQVRSNGEIKWQGDFVHICSSLAGEAIAVEETEDGHWQGRFFSVPVGISDQKTRKLRRCASAAPQRTEP